MTKIKKAVIPAAGLGTRMLPISKSVPKEMLPIVDRPAISFLVEEAVAAGAEDILIITGRGKDAIENYFDYSVEYEQKLLASGKQKEIDDAMEKLTEAQKALNNFNAVAPIDGTVTTCTLAEGAEVKSGDTVIIISNTTTMLVNITVDDRNISFVKPGMTVDLTDWNGNVFTGTVSSINTGSAEAGQGMTGFPVTLTVDNYDGSLLEGVWLDYSFVASQSDDCIVVPMQSVKYVSDENGETASVVFIKADSKPENTVAIDIPPTEPGATPLYPSESEGFYPVPVTTGLSDNYNVEIKEGLTGDEEVFVNYYVEQAWG